MKIIIVLIATLFVGCMTSLEQYSTSETKVIQVVIDKISVGKQSVIEGHAYYNNIYVPVRNSNSGYYYKKYNLSVGQTISMTVTIFMDTKYNTEIWGETDFNKYSIE